MGCAPTRPRRATPIDGAVAMARPPWRRDRRVRRYHVAYRARRRCRPDAPPATRPRAARSPSPRARSAARPTPYAPRRGTRSSARRRGPGHPGGCWPARPSRPCGSPPTWPSTRSGSLERRTRGPGPRLPDRAPPAGAAGLLISRRRGGRDADPPGPRARRQPLGLHPAAPRPAAGAASAGSRR